MIFVVNYSFSAKSGYFSHLSLARISHTQLRFCGISHKQRQLYVRPTTYNLQYLQVVWPEHFWNCIFFWWKCGEKIEKNNKIVKKSENLCNKIQFFWFLLLNILDQNFKISTIVESLVTLFARKPMSWQLPKSFSTYKHDK